MAHIDIAVLAALDEGNLSRWRTPRRQLLKVVRQQQKLECGDAPTNTRPVSQMMNFVTR
jgi:hypothetical protein